MKKSSYLLYITSMLIYGTVGLFRRGIPLPSGMLALIRGVIGGGVLLAVAALSRQSLFRGIRKQHLLFLLLSGAALGINWILLFEAYNHTTVATATLCYYMAPTILILLSPLLFGEKLTVRKGLCAAVSVGGMVLVSGVAADGGADLKGIACGLGAAVFYAVIVILNKKTPIDNVYGKTVIQLFASAVIVTPYVLLFETADGATFDVTAVIMIAVLGIAHTGLAYAMYFGNIHRLPSQTVAVLSYLDPIAALLLSALILGETMAVWQAVGAVMILVAAVISELSPTHRKTP